MMDANRERKVMRWTAALVTILQITLIASCYTIAVRDGYLNPPKLYLSASFRRDPTRAIAGFILPLNAIGYGIILSARLFRISVFVNKRKEEVLFWGAVLATGGAVVGMIGVAAVSLDLDKTLHWAAAVLLFSCANILMICLTVLDDSLNFIRPKWLRVVRILISVLGVLSIIMMGAATSFNFLVASIFEFLLAALLVAYIFSLVHDSSFPLMVAVKEPRSPRPTGRDTHDSL
jgi:hypothetical protein